jgi:hypothetical protein
MQKAKHNNLSSTVTVAVLVGDDNTQTFCCLVHLTMRLHWKITPVTFQTVQDLRKSDKAHVKTRGTKLLIDVIVKQVLFSNYGNH